MFISDFHLLEKQASLVSGGAGAVLGYLIPYIGNKYLVSAAEDVLSGMEPRKDFPSIVQKIKEKAHMKDIPHNIADGVDNAFFVPPNMVGKEEERKLVATAQRKRQSGSEDDLSEAKVIDYILGASRNIKGGIIIGKRMTNPYTVAHEMGHAILQNEGSVAGFMQRHAQKANVVGNILSGLAIVPAMASIINSASGTENATVDNIARGLAYTGAAASVAGDVGRIVYENRASDIGRELIGQSGIEMSDEEIKRGEELYSKALGTYMISPLEHVLPIAGYELSKNLF